MIVLRFCIVLISFILMIRLYQRAAGTLSIKKLNMNSLAFYFLLIYCFVGTSAIYLGFRNHYLLLKCSEDTIEKTYWIVMYALLVLPIGIIVFERAMNIKNFNKFFSDYSRKKVENLYESEKTMFTILFLLTVIGGLALIYTFYYIGYIPLFELLKGNFSITSQRASIAREFAGNQYIRNLFALMMIPALSYIAYIYYRLTKQLKWLLLFGILFIMSIMCKTYAFEKAPVIVYIAYFYIIEIMLNSTISIGKIAKYIIVGAILILFAYYVISGYTGDLFTLSSGPFSRLFITQISTCYLHVQAFPGTHSFLNGASFPSVLSWIFGASESGVRSGRVVMSIYNASGVASGTAGVMNSLYVADAYANFGYFGVAISPWIVAFFITIIPCFILKQRKTPVNIALYIIFSSTYANALVGGFIDFVYNISLVFILLLFIMIAVVSNRGKIKIYR